MPRITRKRRPRAIGAYIFAGGFTIGVLKHFDVVAHFENDLFGTQTVNLNFPHIEIHKDLDDWPLAMPCIDFIYANPPCAPWSMAGIVNSRRKTVADWRNHSQLSCVNNAFCLIEEYVPKVWCFESVRRVYTAGGSMLDSFAYRAMDMGYAVSDVFVEASNHGVPQRRPRYFMVCHKVDIEWQAPRLPNNATANNSDRSTSICASQFE